MENHVSPILYTFDAIFLTFDVRICLRRHQSSRMRTYLTRICVQTNEQLRQQVKGNFIFSVI